MDGTRHEDLKRLHSIFTNPRKPRIVRSQAHRAFTNIKKQVEDKKLSEMRRRLIRAVRAGDEEFAEKIGRRIQEYSWRMGYQKDAPDPITTKVDDFSVTYL